MRLGRWVRLVPVVSLAAAACGGTPPPVTQPRPPVQAPAPASATDPNARLMVATAESAPIPAGTISGRVLSDDAPAKPIARARVILTSDTLTEARVAISGEDGAFTFEKLPAGSYTMSASASGFAPQYYAHRRSGPPPPISLADGQRLTALEITLPAAGVIAGQILDEDGRPFAGATVDALVSRTVEGQATLVSMATATTDDKGGFRLASLPAGQYYVSAFDPAFAQVGDHTGPLRYTATYYPGVSFIEQATKVSVTPHVEPDVKIVFKLKIVRPAIVSGMIAAPDKRQLMSGAVIMSPIHGEALASIPSDDVQIMPDGSFIFRNVAPGLYQIRARAEVDPTSVALFATYRIRVDGRDITHVDMALLPGAVVSGRVGYEAIDTPKPLTFGGVRVRAPFWDGSSFGDALTGDVLPDGSYRIRGLMPGTHQITVEGLEYPWVLKEVTWRGQDITDIALDVESRQAFDDIQVTLTDAANDVSGTVRDAHGRPAGEALVMIIPLAEQFWRRTSRRLALVYSDASGRYRVRGLPQGEYRAVASLDFDESEVYRHELLSAFAGEGTAVALGERGSHVIDLSLTSLRRASTR